MEYNMRELLISMIAFWPKDVPRDVLKWMEHQEVVPEDTIPETAKEFWQYVRQCIKRL